MIGVGNSIGSLDEMEYSLYIDEIQSFNKSFGVYRK